MPRGLDYRRIDLWRFSVPRGGTDKPKKTKRRQRFAWLYRERPSTDREHPTTYNRPSAPTNQKSKTEVTVEESEGTEQ